MTTVSLPIDCDSSKSIENLELNCSKILIASPDNFLLKGKIAALYGANAGWKCKTVRASLLPSTPSSSYASHKKANVTRSAPSDGSIQYGIYFSFVSDRGI